MKKGININPPKTFNTKRMLTQVQNVKVGLGGRYVTKLKTKTQTQFVSRLVGCMEMKDAVLATIANNGNEVQEHKVKYDVYSIKLEVSFFFNT